MNIPRAFLEPDFMVLELLFLFKNQTQESLHVLLSIPKTSPSQYPIHQ